MTLDELEKEVRKEQQKESRKQKKTRFALWLLIGMLLLASGGLIFLAAKRQGGAGTGTFSEASESILSPEDGIWAQVQVIDVGQGSATLILSGGEAMLIDGGGAAHSSVTVAALKKSGVTRLKYLVATHFDADHLYGAIGALEAVGAEKVLLPDYTADSAVYTSFMRHLEAKAGETETIHPKPGETYRLGFGEFTILAPCSGRYEAENDYSIALRFAAGGSSLLITGDAEKVSEEEMRANNRGRRSLASDIYIVGHHGSASSSSAAFLKDVSPSYAIISCGAGNDYGHPKEAVLRRLKLLEIQLYRTDVQGDILFRFTGDGIVWEKEPCNNYTPG